MNTEKTIEKIWTEFLVKVVRPDIPPSELKYISEVFHWGAMLMARELMENQNEFLFRVNEELKQFMNELNGETKSENPN